MANNTQDLNWGAEDESANKPLIKGFIKENVNEYDIFVLAQRVLSISALIFVVFAFIRIFYRDENEEAIKEVWDYTKVILNSIVSLVLGLYFSSKTRKG